MFSNSNTTVFFWVFQKMVPFALLLLLGFFAGRKLKVDRESIVKLLVYLIVPSVFFTNIAIRGIEWRWFWVTIWFFGVSAVFCFVTLALAKWIFKERSATTHLAAFCVSGSNCGYSFLPLAVFLFGESILPVLTVFILGYTLFESSIGFYVLARGRSSAKQAFLKVIRIPAIYAVILGALVREIPGFKGDYLIDIAPYLRGTFTVLGMIVLGLGLSEIRKFRFNLGFISYTFFMKMFLCPLVFWCIAISPLATSWLDLESRKLMILIAACPLAINAVAFSVLLKTEPDLAATGVFMSMMLSLLTLPIVWILTSTFLV